ncbi:MAG: 6-bladed beta-propeller [Motiliproteus sp.]
MNRLELFVKPALLFTRSMLLKGLVVLGMLLQLGGCSVAPENEYAFKFPVSDGLSVWPAPPEQPRFEYIGDLIGEDGYALKQSRGFQLLAEIIAGVGLEPQSKVGLVRPQSGMVDAQGRVYVTDVGRGAVFVFDPVAGIFSVWDHYAPGQSFTQPIGITAGREGHVLVVDAEKRSVIELDASGVLVGSFGQDLLQRPTGIARDPVRGRIFVADTHGDDIKVFSDSGELLDVWGVSGDLPGQFNSPVHLWFADNRLYVTDTLNARVQMLDDQGQAQLSVGKRGLIVGNFVRPKGITLDAEGNLYVVESYYDHLLIYDKEGRFLLPIGGAGQAAGKFFLPAGVWSDSDNRIYVADMMNGRVSIFQYLANNPTVPVAANGG